MWNASFLRGGICTQNFFRKQKVGSIKNKPPSSSSSSSLQRKWAHPGNSIFSSTVPVYQSPGVVGHALWWMHHVWQPHFWADPWIYWLHCHLAQLSAKQLCTCAIVEEKLHFLLHCRFLCIHGAGELGFSPSPVRWLYDMAEGRSKSHERISLGSTSL